ncbi:ABC transporter ATP-binding protein [Crassaminicella thermophila]|uniref:ABC transporter ATP-binding protein n=1 Tax=Crassaminicella thermophila TaxID=2599308 RepID=A0A5C0SFN5_CRATE|nr:ABC transporter ATP-binding protein [Crassaminicella thermophila]QEK13030.1 ABC transporter ATP-binding protein [Crassaminicella thermophila]
MKKKLLEVHNLKTYFFGDHGVVPAVDGVDILIHEGETLGVVGESGCGKSVTSLSIMRLLMDTPGKVINGSIKFEGKDLLQLSEKEMQEIRGNDIAMIFQEPMTSLNPVLRIGEQIQEAVELHLKYDKNKAKKHVIGMLKLVGIPRAEEIYYEYPYQLSGGMRQRVMIAMAMSCDPKLLIADEPTTALDVTIQAQILDLMRKLQNENGTSIMLITHDLGVVAEMCDRVVVMYAGRVVEEADVFQIFEEPKHPYTIGLLNSIPKLRQKIDRLDSIPGIVPNPTNMPKGCKFAPRCQHAMDHCLEREPSFYQVGEHHKCKCWLYQSELAKEV